MFCDSDGNIRLKPLKPSKHFVKKRTKAVLSEKKRIQTSKNGSVTFSSRLCQGSLCRQFGNGQFDREMVSQCTRQVTNFATYRTGKPSIEKRQMVQISTVPKDNAEPRFCFLSSVTLSFVNAFRRFRRRVQRVHLCINRFKVHAATVLRLRHRADGLLLLQEVFRLSRFPPG